MGPVLYAARRSLDLRRRCWELSHDQCPLSALRIDVENPSNKLDPLSHEGQAEVDMGIDRTLIKPYSVVFNAYAEITAPVRHIHLNGGRL